MPEANERTRDNVTNSRASHPKDAQSEVSEGGRPVEPSGEEATQLSADMVGEETTSDAQYLSPAELADKMDDLTRVIQEKFLSGMDSEYVDYGQIDNNAALDDD